MIWLLLLAMATQPMGEIRSAEPLTFHFTWQPADDTHDGFILEYNPPGRGNKWEVILKLPKDAREYTLIEPAKGRHCYRWRAFNNAGYSPPGRTDCGRN